MTFHQRGGSKIWNVVFRLRGRQRFLSTGTPDFEEAQLRGAELILRDAGRFIGSRPEQEATPEEVQTDAGIERVLDLYKRWLESPIQGTRDRRPRAHTADAYARRLRQVADHLGAALVSELKAKAPTMSASSFGIAEENFVPMVRGAASIFSERALRYFEQHGLQIANPFVGYIPQVIPAKPFAPPLRDFLKSLMDAARAELKPRDPGAYLLIVIALGSGQRQQEAAHMRKRDVLSTGLRVVTLSDYKNKTNRFRDIPVAEGLLAELMEFAKGDPNAWLIPNSSEPGKPCDGIPRQRAIRAARRACKWLRDFGVEDKHPLHFLRKSFGTSAAEKHGIFVASKWLGHSSVVQTEKVYAGVAADKRPDWF